MKLRPFLIAWLLWAIAMLVAARGFGPDGSARVAALYACGSFFVVAGMALAYRRRLRHFLAEERSQVWRALQADTGAVSTRRLFAWGLSPADRGDAEIQAARTTGSLVLVIVLAWLVSTPTTCLLLAMDAS